MNDATGDTRKRWHPRTPSLCGLAVAAVFFWLSFTPSLLPVPWLYQGLATGVSAAAGYAIGAFVGWVVRALAGRPIPKRVMRWAWLALAVAGPIVLIVAVIQGHAWLNEMERLVQMPEAGVATTLVAALHLIEGLAIFLLIMTAPSERETRLAFVASAMVQSAIAIAQMFFQRVYPDTWLGVAAHYPEVAGTSVVEAAGGGTVVFPPASYFMSAGVTVTGNNVALLCASVAGATRQRPFATVCHS